MTVDRRRIALIGMLTAMFQACYFASIAVTSVSIATLISIGATPVLVLTAETLYGQRKADRWSILMVGLALTGFLLLVGVPQNQFTVAQMLAGAGLAFAASAGFATVTLVSSRQVSRLDDLTTTGYAFTLGGGALAIIAWPAAGLSFPASSSSIGLLILLGTLPTAVAYTLYFRGLRTASASTASLMALLEPLTGAILAAIFLHDRLSPAGLTGAALMIAAVTIAAMTPRPATA